MIVNIINITFVTTNMDVRDKYYYETISLTLSFVPFLCVI